MRKLKLLSTGEMLEFISVSFSADIENWALSFSLELADLLTYEKLVYQADSLLNYIPIEITIGLETWSLIVETSSSNGTQKTYSVGGRAKTALLSEPHAAQISKTWTGELASAIVQEMAQLGGITLNWNITDWTVENYTCQNQYPIDVIKTFVAEIDARVQTLPDGTLQMVYWYSDNPIDLPALTPVHEFSTELLIFDRSKTRENRNNNNLVLVTTDNAANNSSPTPTIEEFESGENRLYKVRCNPFFPVEVINLQHKSTGAVDLVYVGSFTEQVIDSLIISDGAGQLSKQFDALVSVAWSQDVSGALSIAADGKITCSGQAIGLAKITYLTRYLLYQGTRTDPAIEETLLFTADIGAVESSAGLSLTLQLKGSAGDRIADPIIVKTLSTAEALRRCGLAYLWQNGYDVDRHTLEIPYMGNPVLPGAVAKIIIVGESLEFNCFVKSVSVGYGADGLTQQLILDRPLI
jgi:hypothetical protein